MTWAMMEFLPGTLGLFAVHTEHKTCEQSARIFDLDDELPMYNCTMHVVDPDQNTWGIH